MARPRTKNKHLPRYVTIIHGSYWYRPPNAKPIKLARVGDESSLHKNYARFAFPSERNDKAGVLSDYIDRYEREIVPTLAPRTQKDYHRHLQKLRQEFGHIHPDDVQPRDIGRFLDVPKGKIHRVRMVAVLSSIYGYMVGAWYVAEKNPCRDVKRTKNPPRDRYVTNEEFDAIHSVMPLRLQIAMELALLTCQRQGDLIALKWADVKDDGIYFRQQKTGQGRIVERSEALNAVLERARRLVPQVPKVYVLHTRMGKPYSSDGFRAIWQRYMRKAMENGVIAERFRFHDLRAKSVSDEDDVEIAQLRAGHISKAMTLRVYSRKMRRVTALR
jgi:integrase